MRNILSYSANQVARYLGDDATIWINPGKIVHHVGNIKTRKAKHVGKLFERMNLINKDSKNANFFYRNRYVISDEDFKVRDVIAESEKFALVEDFVSNIENYEKSRWFEQMSQDLATDKVATYKNRRFTSNEEIKRFFETYLVPLGVSLADQGYDETQTKEKCKCYVSADGEIMKGENGRHRLAFAKALKLDRFPLTVFGVHEDWFSGNIGTEMDFSKIRQQYRLLASRYA